MKKECYGNFLMEGCTDHHGCFDQSQCIEDTNVKYGLCECLYKKHCHLPRQKLQSEIKKRKPGWICTFSKLYEKYHD